MTCDLVAEPILVVNTSRIPRTGITVIVSVQLIVIQNLSQLHCWL